VINIEVDGTLHAVAEGSLIIDVVDSLGKRLPRFCYHPQLSVVASCRMCLVEVNQATKLLPACATTVTSGMQIATQSTRVLESQRAVMEFLLINHPLDCPVCDQGGECELQDLAWRYGLSRSRYREEKREVLSDNFGPLIASEMTRCIHCTRCVRFGKEILQVPSLAVTDRGEHTQISSVITESLSSELSANVVDLCPVGALTDKAFHAVARSWELIQVPGIAMHDCMGSNLYWHVYRGQIVRVVPRANAAINNIWLSDRDRYSFQALYHPERLREPMQKVAGVWQSCSWDSAINSMHRHLSHLAKHSGPANIAACISPNTTLEEQYLFQAYVRSYGCHNIDYRLHYLDDSASLPLFRHTPITAVTEAKLILLLGFAALEQQQPLLAVATKQAETRGATVLAFGPELPLVASLAALAKAALELQPERAPAGAYTWLSKIASDSQSMQLATTLAQQPSVLCLSPLLEAHPQRSILWHLVALLEQLTQTQVLHLTSGSNACGAQLMGCHPQYQAYALLSSESEQGCSMRQCFNNPRQAYLLYGLEPEDFAESSLASASLSQAEYIVAFTAFTSASLQRHANLLLPLPLPGEGSGSTINYAGCLQTFAPAVSPPAGGAPAWQRLVQCGLQHSQPWQQELFASFSVANLQQTVAKHLPQYLQASTWQAPALLLEPSSAVVMCSQPLHPYQQDYMVRRAAILQEKLRYLQLAEARSSTC
jgi:NADH-quinone oxidoreductase subunit G